MTDATSAAPLSAQAAQSEHEFCAKAGPLPAPGGDGRRFPRFNFRACINAVVYPSAADAAEQPLACQVLTRDISRSGINIVHKAQLFPGQAVTVVLNDGVERSVEVIWCRRLGAGCYSAGCRFVRQDDPAPREACAAPQPPAR
jgi:hypothetical protein